MNAPIPALLLLVALAACNKDTGQTDTKEAPAGVETPTDLVERSVRDIEAARQAATVPLPDEEEDDVAASNESGAGDEA